MSKVRAIQPAFWRELAFCLALIALTFRALVPIGFMPDTQRGTGHLITICSEYGQSQIAVDGDNQPIKSGSHAHEQPCGFSINTATTGGHDLNAIITPVYFQAVFFVGFDVVQTLFRKFHAPSRAPPFPKD